MQHYANGSNPPRMLMCQLRGWLAVVLQETPLKNDSIKGCRAHPTLPERPDAVVQLLAVVLVLE